MEISDMAKELYDATSYLAENVKSLLTYPPLLVGMASAVFDVATTSINLNIGIKPIQESNLAAKMLQYAYGLGGGLIATEARNLSLVGTVAIESLGMNKILESEELREKPYYSFAKRATKLTCDLSFEVYGLVKYHAGINNMLHPPFFLAVETNQSEISERIMSLQPLLMLPYLAFMAIYHRDDLSYFYGRLKNSGRLKSAKEFISRKLGYSQ